MTERNVSYWVNDHSKCIYRVHNLPTFSDDNPDHRRTISANNLRTGKYRRIYIADIRMGNFKRLSLEESQELDNYFNSS